MRQWMEGIIVENNCRNAFLFIRIFLAEMKCFFSSIYKHTYFFALRLVQLKLCTQILFRIVTIHFFDNKREKTVFFCHNFLCCSTVIATAAAVAAILAGFSFINSIYSFTLCYLRLSIHLIRWKEKKMVRIFLQCKRIITQNDTN